MNFYFKTILFFILVMGVYVSNAKAGLEPVPTTKCRIVEVARADPFDDTVKAIYLVDCGVCKGYMLTRQQIEQATFLLTDQNNKQTTLTLNLKRPTLLQDCYSNPAKCAQDAGAIIPATTKVQAPTHVRALSEGLSLYTDIRAEEKVNCKFTQTGTQTSTGTATQTSNPTGTPSGTATGTSTSR